MTLTKDKIYKNTKEKSKNTKDEEAKRFSSFGFYFYLLKYKYYIHINHEYNIYKNLS